jgi:ABC-type branched-subunit amino acid transport system ATPase component
VRYRNGAIGVHDLSFAVPEGSIFGLVGRNGAGKTSTIAAIAGFARSERVTVEGSILFDGHQLAGLRSAAVSKLGVALVQERDKVFPSLSVSDHLRAAGLTRGQIGPFLDRFAPLASRAGSPAGLLSGGQRQLLALAMCLARRPKLLLVDEMSLGLAPIAVKALLTELRQIREEHGVTILLVDQATAAVSELADYIYVVENGEIAMHGAADQLAEADVRDAIIGSGVR